MGYEHSLPDLLRALSSAIDQVALQSEVDEPGGNAPVAGGIREIERNADALAALAMKEYQARRSRERFVSPELLGEPAWDILIDLFIQQASGKSVSVTSAAIASRAPPSTALRHLAALQKAGLVERARSATDARVKLLRLTKDGYRRIGSWLHERASAIVRKK